MFPNYQRYYMFDLLDASGIEYDRVLTVDDTFIHPNGQIYLKKHNQIYYTWYMMMVVMIGF